MLSKTKENYCDIVGNILFFCEKVDYLQRTEKTREGTKFASI